ncbi:MAG: Crp/Fnr family transcriptional regulator [Proteiniphilum sp.]|jgi:CRP-like cAMP-binding protein|nr:Crp/Fnr family transcriptional regulator [Proteiniphilum sp.]MDD2938645.1 Crp/Fnr family transcriptional regulator [Proteiniphilum sp.]MDD3955145.1 Crp/Fnr family transcriptional regulator [Proteiniphilum sp.]MDD4452057.1 Crp/Fnr family transcriptional regulator [Proteiniphilum sp.]NCB25230.1 Crp/Fnr family transcriptional regulator [Bacteroidia bacterium]
MEKQKTLHNVYQHPLLTDKDLAIINALHKRVVYNKGDFYLRKGENPHSYLILQKGLMRSFVFDYDGNEITTHFFTEQEVVIEVLSLFKHASSEESIQALTECVCWEIDFEAFEKLFHTIPGLSEWGRAWFSEELSRFKQRSVQMITQRASERYMKLLKEKPQIIRQAPLKQIATYLGITDTSLSRIRKELSRGCFPAAR